MDKKDILKKVDHTLLGQTATWDDIRGILDDAMKYEAASACIPAAYVKQAAEYVAGKLPIEQNRCAMACQGCGAVLFLLKKQWNYFS